jgi:SOS-response transcriptional repressor LexA
MHQKLTTAQREIYAYIAGFIEDNNCSPTYQEIAMRVGSTTQMVEAHIKNIVKKGYIQFNGNKHRKIELIPK